MLHKIYYYKTDKNKDIYVHTPRLHSAHGRRIALKTKFFLNVSIVNTCFNVSTNICVFVHIVITSYCLSGSTANSNSFGFRRRVEQPPKVLILI